MTRSTALIFLAWTASFIARDTACAKVSLPAIFGDHMVLQQAMTLPVWGWAEPGERVRVVCGNDEQSVITGADGKWRVHLPAQTASPQATTLRVSGTNTLVLNDVLIGDVWLCAGQSNMFFPLRNADQAAEAMASADFPMLRLFLVSRQVSWTTQEDLTGTKRATEGRWVICRPDDPALAEFSAVGYFFGREILANRHQPLGLIRAAYGGSPAEAWMSEPALTANPPLQHYATRFAEAKRTLPQAEADYTQRILPAWHAQYAAWQKQADETRLGGDPDWQKLAPKQPRRPIAPGSNQRTPVVLYNGMIAPLAPFGLKGVIWYQGESNAITEAQAREYGTLFPALIADWRAQWEHEDLPFLYVQLSAYSTPQPWAVLREAQLATLALPTTGMAVSIDVGEEHDIHPRNKAVIGHRLAVLARHVAYGENTVCSGPRLASLTREGNRLRLNFTQIGSGLVVGSSGVTAPQPLRGFSIAGVDGVFQPAKARIEDDHVVVWSRSVAQPDAVRYGWSSYPLVNLYNREGLPASPFSAGLPRPLTPQS